MMLGSDVSALATTAASAAAAQGLSIVVPLFNEAAGLALTKTIQPLDAEGKPSADGKIVVLGIGFSNTVQVYSGFMQVAKEDKEINPRVVLVNGAVGGMSANMIQDPDKGRGRGSRKKGKR